MLYVFSIIFEKLKLRNSGIHYEFHEIPEYLIILDISNLDILGRILENSGFMVFLCFCRVFRQHPWVELIEGKSKSFCFMEPFFKKSFEIYNILIFSSPVHIPHSLKLLVIKRQKIRLRNVAFDCTKQAI